MPGEWLWKPISEEFQGVRKGLVIYTYSALKVCCLRRGMRFQLRQKVRKLEPAQCWRRCQIGIGTQARRSGR